MQFFFIHNSKRRICNPFKCYPCFFSIEGSQGGQLRVTISSRSVSSSGRRAWLNTEAETTSSTPCLRSGSYVCYQCMKAWNSHSYSNCWTDKGGNFRTVCPLLPLIVIPCSVSKFNMAISVVVYQLASLSLMEFRCSSVLLSSKGSLLKSAIFFCMNTFKRAWALRNSDRR